MPGKGDVVIKNYGMVWWVAFRDLFGALLKGFTDDKSR